MSEKKEDKEWEKVVRTLISEELEPIKATLNRLSSVPVKAAESKEEKHEHWKAEDLLNPACPECKTEEQKLTKMLKKKDAEANRNLEYECVECGTHFGKKEKRCPECGTTRVRTL